jgi:iron complex outermembrane receptor protein
MVGLFYYEQTTERGGTGEPFVIVGEDFIPIASQQALPFPLPVNLLVQPGDNLVADFEQDTDTIAAFGQATWHFGDAWHLTGGLRWTDEEKESRLFSETNSTAFSAAILGVSFLDSVSTPIDATLKRSSENVDWLLRASMDIGESSMIFASAGTGTKSGGFNSVNGTPEQREFDDEETLSYELGLKAMLLESRLRLNATLFRSEIDDYQSQQQLETGLGTFVSNDAQVETAGLDLQLEAVPLPNLTLNAGLLYMDKYEISRGPNAGSNLPFTADLSANLSATLVFPLGDGGIYWRTDYSYMDEHSTNVAPESRLKKSDIDDRNLLNTKLGWRNDSWNISVWGRNLTDDEYATQTVDTFIVSGMDAYFLAEPRTYGATLRYDF